MNRDHRETTVTVLDHTCYCDDCLRAWATDQGYIAVRAVDRGADSADQIAAITVTAIGAGQLIVGTLTGVSSRYTFEHFHTAMASLLLWESMGFAGEPYGWQRHQPSDRRRRDGDHITEYIAP